MHFPHLVAADHGQSCQSGKSSMDKVIHSHRIIRGRQNFTSSSSSRSVGIMAAGIDFMVQQISGLFRRLPAQSSFSVLFSPPFQLACSSILLISPAQFSSSFFFPFSLSPLSTMLICLLFTRLAINLTIFVKASLCLLLMCLLLMCPLLMCLVLMCLLLICLLLMCLLLIDLFCLRNPCSFTPINSGLYSQLSIQNHSLHIQPP